MLNYLRSLVAIFFLFLCAGVPSRADDFRQGNTDTFYLDTGLAVKIDHSDKVVFGFGPNVFWREGLLKTSYGQYKLFGAGFGILVGDPPLTAYLNLTPIGFANSYFVISPTLLISKYSYAGVSISWPLNHK
jgi:hypothetical protein